MICPNCGHEAKENDRFCVMCATKLVPSEGEMTAAAEAAADEINELAKPVEETAAAVEKAAEVQEPTTYDEAFAQQDNEPITEQKEAYDKKDACCGGTDKPLTTWGFIWRILLISIPIFNIIPLFVFAFASGINKNSRSFARAILVFMLIALIILLVGAAVLLIMYNGEDVLNYIKNLFTPGAA